MGKKRQKRALAAQAAPTFDRRPAPASRYGSGTNVYTRTGGGSSFLFGWNPALREPIFDVREGWVGAASRAIDSLQNSGFMAGAVETACGQMIGSGLRLNAKPDPALFGDNEASAETWAQMVERRFTQWGASPWDCDLGARFTLGQLQDQAVRQYFATGEIVATLPMVQRPGNTVGLKVNVMPSMRLVQGSIMGGPYNQVQGVILGPNHEPAAYAILNAALVWGVFKQDIVQARTADGRPAVIHLFTGEPGAVRGITPLAPVLKVVRQIDQLADATLTAALLQTIFAATVESDAFTKDVMQAFRGGNEQDVDGAIPGDFDNLMSQRFEWYNRSTRVDLGNFGKIAHMFPGETLKFNSTNHPNQNYEAFFKSLLREISRCLCISYESVSNDYSHATYSSVRQASSDLWQLTEKRRAFYPARMMQMIYGCFLEETIDAGLIEFPGGIEAFRANRAAACNADWRGPAKPLADDLKAAKAMQIARAERWVGRDQLCQEWAGGDWIETARQIAAEEAEDERLGLDPLPTVGGGGASAGVQADVAGGEDGSGGA
jgi:lambda family phage portal protein